MILLAFLAIPFVLLAVICWEDDWQQVCEEVMKVWIGATAVLFALAAVGFYATAPFLIDLECSTLLWYTVVGHSVWGAGYLLYMVAVMPVAVFLAVISTAAFVMPVRSAMQAIRGEKDGDLT